MEKHSRLDGEGLLFLLQQLIARIDKGAVEIDSALSAESTNDCAAGSRAVFELVNAAASECVKAEELSEIAGEEVRSLLDEVWEV
ncbi:MAG: hypothetical protein ACI4J0_04985 [Huintestinicola sp.]|uniref:hypothetical protein n=1 Tax=Huintestinicola sp. TaxID=2981661 RepID=UPI003F038783